MLEWIVWVLLLVSVCYAVWYNYHHFEKLMDGTISIDQELIALGSIGITIILFLVAVLMRIF